MRDMKVEKEVVVTFAWVTQREHAKGAMDKINRPEGPPTRSLGPEGPYNSSSHIYLRTHFVGKQILTLTGE